MVKKVLLTATVTFTFIAYVFHQKSEEITDASSVVIPNSSKPTQSEVFPSPAPSVTAQDTPAPTKEVNKTNTGMYKDGVYTGDITDAFYGYVQVKTVISGGKITDVQFLQYPSDRNTSIEINSQAMPYLRQEAIAAQSANVNIVTGATQTSLAFIDSLASSLAKAK